MSFISILETLFIGPLKLVFEIIFTIANRFIGHPGYAIIILSLIMNILVLPLYRRADAMQEAARDVDMKLRDGVAHIKKTFSGDERMMILQTYYRQNNYKPTDALNGSVSLLLEIPFFMAAYQFLSNLSILDGVSLGPITDLGAPDGLLVIGGVAINVLPILMTLVNVISSALYLKGFPLKTKIQLYGMALFFLVFLYTSPACLVFYWTLNNVFSLVKTIFYKLKNPQRVLRILTSVVGVGFFALGFLYETENVKRRLFLFALAVGLQLPLLLPMIKKHLPTRAPRAAAQPNRKIFLLGCVCLTVLVGLLIPATFIAASPQEYVDITYFHHPLWYIVSAVCLAAGTFLVWMGVFYWLASDKGKAIFDKLVWVLCGVMLVNYMFFGTGLGNMSAMLQYDVQMTFSWVEQVVNVLVIAAVAAVMLFCAAKWKRIVPTVLVTAILALGGMSAVHMVTIKNSVDEVKTLATQEGDTPQFTLSKTGKNVVVLMLDRALGQYVPYLMNEKPEIKQQFDGFTYYENTLAYGGFTNFGTPPIFGGYEYTPVEMNKRDDEPLVDKHNESLKVMPQLFADNGYDVTVCDPVYANYQWIPDLSVYDGMDVDAYITKGRFGDVSQKERVVSNNHRNFFCFSVMKSMPLFLQPTIYNAGAYNQAATPQQEQVYSAQTLTGDSTATGLFASFMESYNVLDSMSYMTNILDEEKNTFLMMSSDLTHEVMLLQQPDYVPSMTVDNTAYDVDPTRTDADGNTIRLDTVLQRQHYQSNMAALQLLGDWFDYLREQGVYDNTRIILVADHGRNIQQVDSLVIDEKDAMKDLEFYYPLLMVKDFDSEGYTTSSEFMTNADVPTLATDGVIADPKNPYTGKPINSDEKTAHEQLVLMSNEAHATRHTGNTFLPDRWASVTDDVRDPDNWAFCEEKVVLKEHALP